MILLHNGNWKHSATEEGIRIPGALQLALALTLFIVSFFLSGCETSPLKPDTSITDFWEQIVRPESRKPVTAMTYTGIGDLLIAQDGAGLLRYREETDGFTLVDKISLPDNRITELFSDSTTGFLYAGSFGGTLYRSTDFGSSWVDITPAFDPDKLDDGLLNYCAGIAASPAYELFAAFNGHGIFYSTDFGTSWVDIFGPPQVHGITAMDLTPEINMYVGTMAEGLFQGGTLSGIPYWTVTTGLTPHATSIVTFEKGAFIGTDGGRIYSWQETSEGFGEATGSTPLPGAVMDMILSPGHTLYIAVHNSGVYRIGNGISGNQPVNAGLFDRHVRALAFDPDGYILAATETEGVFRSVFPAQFHEAQQSD